MWNFLEPRKGEVRRIYIPRTGVKIALAAAYFHGFGVARLGPWVTPVNKGKKSREAEVSLVDQGERLLHLRQP